MTSRVCQSASLLRQRTINLLSRSIRPQARRHRSHHSRSARHRRRQKSTNHCSPLLNQPTRKRASPCSVKLLKRRTTLHLSVVLRAPSPPSDLPSLPSRTQILPSPLGQVRVKEPTNPRSSHQNPNQRMRSLILRFSAPPKRRTHQHFLLARPRLHLVLLLVQRAVHPFHLVRVLILRKQSPCLPFRLASLSSRQATRLLSRLVSPRRRRRRSLLHLPFHLALPHLRAMMRNPSLPSASDLRTPRRHLVRLLKLRPRRILLNQHQHLMHRRCLAHLRLCLALAQLHLRLLLHLAQCPRRQTPLQDPRNPPSLLALLLLLRQRHQPLQYLRLHLANLLDLQLRPHPFPLALPIQASHLGLQLRLRRLRRRQVSLSEARRLLVSFSLVHLSHLPAIQLHLRLLQRRHSRLEPLLVLYQALPLVICQPRLPQGLLRLAFHLEPRRRTLVMAVVVECSTSARQPHQEADLLSLCGNLDDVTRYKIDVLYH